jgi:hypothetical protein
VSAITLTVVAPAAITRGEFVCAVVRVENTGTSATEVSGRLNLFEGDVRVRLTDPSGRARRIHGAYQVDSAPRRITLGPGERLEAGVNLFFTSAGITFAEPGEYTLQFEYDPSVTSGTVVSDAVPLVVHETSKAEERTLAELTINPAVGRAVAMVEASSKDEAWDRLERLATSFPTRQEGWIARLVLAAQSQASAAADDTFSTPWPKANLVELAHWISALATPASSRGRKLSATFSAWLDSSDAAGRDRDRARAIATVRPLK